MTELNEAGSCLNCSAPLQGPFCSACGQRAVPPNPTVRELAGDAWQEMTGYDGRIMSTIRGLARPGFLTRAYLEGRRAHYLPPLRVYLIVSVLYFVIAASAPALSSRGPGEISGPGNMRIGITGDTGGVEMTAEDRAEMQREIEEAHWLLQPMLRSFAEEPEVFRSRMFAVMPRVFFGLLPVFAAIVALFYRRRTFPVSLVFAVHLHAFAFIAFAISETAKFTGREHLFDRVSGIMAIVFAVYALKAFRNVFGGGWPMTMVKAAGIGFVYLVVSVPAIFVMMLWASWM